MEQRRPAPYPRPRGRRARSRTRSAGLLFVSFASALPWRSSFTSRSSLLTYRLHVGGALAGAIGVHESFDRGVQLIPRSVDEIVVAHCKRRADEEFLI